MYPALDRSGTLAAFSSPIESDKSVASTSQIESDKSVAATSQPSDLSPPTSSLSPQPSDLSPQTSDLSPPTSSLRPQVSALSPQVSVLRPQSSALRSQTSGLLKLRLWTRRSYYKLRRSQNRPCFRLTRPRPFLNAFDQQLRRIASDLIRLLIKRRQGDTRVT